MAQLTRTNLKTKYTDSSTGLYKDNSTKAITASRVRTNVDDEADSALFWEDVIDEDNFSTDSATRPPSQQSVRVYADAIIGVGTTSGTNSYTVNVGSPKTILTSGYLYAIKWAAASTGAVTLDIQSAGAKKVFKDPTTQAGNGDLVQNSVSLMMYQSTLDGGTGGYLIIGGSSTVPAADATTSGIGKLYTNTGSNTDGSMTQNAITAEFRKSRTVTTADAIVQTDDNSLIIFNSGSPINFTLDQLTANTKTSFLNIGAGAVTFVNGSGVTLTGGPTLAAAAGTDYPTAFVVYLTNTTPRVVVGGTGGGVSDWGDIGGTLSDQTDLQAALDAKQASDSDLTAIAGLSPSNDDIIQRKSGAWTNRTMAQLASDLGFINSRTNISVSGSGVSGTATMDWTSAPSKFFDIGTTINSGTVSVVTFTISNISNMLDGALTCRITGTVSFVFTDPSSHSVIMNTYEKRNARWNESTNTLTLIGGTASPFILTFYKDSAGTPNIWVFASDPGL